MVQSGARKCLLSAFAHATNSGYEIGQRSLPGRPTAHHIATELALLYAGTIAVNEMEVWRHYISELAHLIAELPTSTEARRSEAEALLAYFWFLGGAPQQFDYFQEANSRAHPLLLEGRRPEVLPTGLTQADVRYYSNPYERLARMHNGEQEMMTGFLHNPMWSSLHW
jgi:hypothetical protein